MSELPISHDQEEFRNAELFGSGFDVVLDSDNQTNALFSEIVATSPEDARSDIEQVFGETQINAVNNRVVSGNKFLESWLNKREPTRRFWSSATDRITGSGSRSNQETAKEEQKPKLTIRAATMDDIEAMVDV